MAIIRPKRNTAVTICMTSALPFYSEKAIFSLIIGIPKNFTHEV